VWFADDATATGRLASLYQWWEHITTIRPYFGYYPNVGKTYLVVKPDLVDEAKSRFENTNVQITVNGQRHLGASIGTQEFIETYVAQMMKCISEIDSIAAVACSNPHAAYTAFVHGAIGRAMQPLEDAIHHKFQDALCLHYIYGCQLKNLPTHCVCRSSFSNDHAMICSHGGLTITRHNEI